MDKFPLLRFDLRANFASAFKLWRERENLPLKKVAADLGFCIATIQAWETGARFPSNTHLGLVILYTGLAPCRLFCGRAGHCALASCGFVNRPA